ncbi:uncharacterized protein EV420DRAFT_1564013 [Desarmillaria tabescens]|uniref:F-box domain-containing protein n=1 Tax=Armillaria tabescens TaxID=1929756 RepID=A0AA39JYG2_ARMTA|nr:uncharacterized protein EV420DRAFT_1564013 [Desarmillaria tabescens]KAK0449784.1 hypothetical protein EV420DRAFT_1564013 [Desarmillaria tabescens]
MMQTRRLEESVAISKTRRGRRAKFFKSQLADVPFEIYLEIFSYLDPVDLLRLARTTKHFSGFLMSRSVLSLWKRARSYVTPLPDMGPLTSEPAIIDFMFEKGCNYCASDENSGVMTMTTTRACRKCILRLHVSESELSANSKTSGLIEFIKAQYSVYFIEPRLVLRKGEKHRTYFLPTMERLGQEYDALNGDQPAISVWMRGKCAEFNSYRRLMAEAGIWWNKQELKAKDNLVVDRLAEVNRRLVTLGWGEELAIIPSHHIADHKLVKKSEKLTEKAWARMEAVLVGILQSHKDKRLLSGRFNGVRNILSNALKCHLISSSTSFAPDYVSLAAMEDCKRILDATPLDQALTEDTFSPVLNRLAEIVDEWRAAKKVECLEMLRQATDTEADEEDLYLATTVFQCLACKQPLMYPKVLVHQCGQLSRRRFSCPQNSDELPWLQSQKLFRFYKGASDVARAIVIACDLDPKVVTYVHMNTLHPLLECLGRHDFGRLVLRWQQGLVHASNHSTTPQFALLEGKDKSEAEYIEGMKGKGWQDIYNEGFNRFRCSDCSEICEASMLGHHLANCHPSFTVEEFAQKISYVTDDPLPDAFISLSGKRRRVRPHE